MFTVMTQDVCPAARLPVAWMLCAPGAAVTAPAGQVDDPAAGFATCRPAGSLSVNDHPFLAVSSDVFVTVNVSSVVLPSGIEAAPKALSSCGLASDTRMLSKAWSLPKPEPWPLRSRSPNCDPETATIRRT